MSKRNARSPGCTAFVSSGSSSSSPGAVSPDLPTSFATFAACWDFATRLLAIFALRIRPLFWLFVVAFNFVGFVDVIFDYAHAIQVDLPANAGELPPSTCRYS